MAIRRSLYPHLKLSDDHLGVNDLDWPRIDEGNNGDIDVVEPEPIEDLETWPPEATPPPITPH